VFPGDGVVSDNRNLDFATTSSRRARKVKRGTKLELSREWTIGAEIGAGGFGRVYSVTDNGEEAVAKLVPKDPGADRELLFVNLDGVRNIVPIVDYGDTSEYWVLVMPRADKSLRQHLDEAERPDLDLQVAVSVLIDIATALTDLDGKVVHRDLKPENVLFLEGSWCLADLRDFEVRRGDYGSRHAEVFVVPAVRSS
jgi:serine/threonine-protein kinase